MQERNLTLGKIVNLRLLKMSELTYKTVKAKKKLGQPIITISETATRCIEGLSFNNYIATFSGGGSRTAATPRWSAL